MCWREGWENSKEKNFFFSVAEFRIKKFSSSTDLLSDKSLFVSQL